MNLMLFFYDFLKYFTEWSWLKPNFSDLLRIHVCVILMIPMTVCACATNESNDDFGWLTCHQELGAPASTGVQSVLMLHGFAGSPCDFGELPQLLASQGYRVLVPVLPGQTRSSPIIKRGSYSPEFYMEWAKNLLETEEQKTGKKPVLIGFSMGGALATQVAAEGYGSRLVLVAPYFSLTSHNDFIFDVARIIRWIIPAIPKWKRGMINSDSGYSGYTPGTWAISLSAFCNLQELAIQAQDTAQEISIPVLIIGSHNDKVASFSITKNVFQDMQNVMFSEYHRSNHIILHDYDKEDATETIIDFLNNGR
jgi:carboxylesterase